MRNDTAPYSGSVLSEPCPTTTPANAGLHNTELGSISNPLSIEGYPGPICEPGDSASKHYTTTDNRRLDLEIKQRVRLHLKGITRQHCEVAQLAGGD